MARKASSNAKTPAEPAAPTPDVVDGGFATDDPKRLAEIIPQLPKVVLHDHLDGGLRPQTVIELAAQIGHKLPSTDADELAGWFAGGGLSDDESPAHGLGSANSSADHDGAITPNRVGDFGSLERYLETFAHTTAVMQTAPALTRIAREAVEDLAADNVVYAELRWAPEQHVAGGLSLDEAVEAVQKGITEGVAAAAANGKTIQAYQILTIMRQHRRWGEIATLAIDWIDKDPEATKPGAVVGADLAGPESYSPEHGIMVWDTLASANVPVTIHAGEAAGLASIASAVHTGHAVRLGHGVRIIDDITATANGEAKLGRLANWIRDRRIPLEVAPTSNLQTHATGDDDLTTHPITALLRLGFTVTINTDNRLMSQTSMSAEMRNLVTQAGWTLYDLFDATVTAANHAFLHYEQRQALILDVITPAFIAAARELARTPAAGATKPDQTD